MSSLVDNNNSIPFSSMSGKHQNRLLEEVGLIISGASWESSPVHDEENVVFDWSKAKEDDLAQREAYMSHINKYASCTKEYGWHDVQPNRYLLSKLVGTMSIKGTCDVVLCRQADIDVKTLRQNLLIVMELKKKVNESNVPQAVAEHIVACMCSPRNRVVTVLTDMVDSFQFWWLSGTDQSILTCKTDCKTGWWLLSHCIPTTSIRRANEVAPSSSSSSSVEEEIVEEAAVEVVGQLSPLTFPAGFLERSNWTAMQDRARLAAVIEVNRGADDDSDGDNDDEDDKEGDGDDEEEDKNERSSKKDNKKKQKKQDKQRTKSRDNRGTAADGEYGSSKKDSGDGGKENNGINLLSSTNAGTSTSSPFSSSSSSDSFKNFPARKHTQRCEFNMMQLVAPLQELYGCRDVGNQLDLLDMVDDSEEQHQIIKQFVMKHQYPHLH
jgi:hypothetical protein